MACESGGAAMTETSAVIFDMYRGTSHDGPGLRTTLFFKGCTLRCTWCHNPEGIAHQPQIWWDGRKCIGCMRCSHACPSGALIADKDGIRINEAGCRHCGACVRSCPSKAQSYTGEKWTEEKLLREALKDKPYYTSFGGGVTASGGEPLVQAEFVQRLFQGLKEHNVHTALDTCGNVAWSKFEAVLPYTDCVLYDLKLMDDGKHRMFTGSGNELILNNIRKLADYIRTQRPELTLWIRTPLIPNATATRENIRQIKQFICNNLLDIIDRWELCAFNNVCRSKYEKMHRTWDFAGEALMSHDQIDEIRQLILTDDFPEEKLVISGVIAAPQNNVPSLR